MISPTVNQKQKLFLVCYFLIFAAFLFLYNYKKSFEVSFFDEAIWQAVEQVEEEQNVSPISGLPCENYNRRPFAVMLANDNVARPLSGLSQAEIIFEMPVIEDGITRLMAVFVCAEPEEIGSVRSARHSFIPLAMGLDAVYAHWGGSAFALEQLNAKVMNNINALPNPFGAFYRQQGIRAPHNGFTSWDRLFNSAANLGYRLENQFAGYAHQDGTNDYSFNKAARLTIDYAKPYQVEYRYSPQDNSYWRWRGGEPEVDKITNQQVAVKNVVIMRAESYHLTGQYNHVDVEGSGRATVYQSGRAIEGRWQKHKTDPKSKLYFLDEQGAEIKFVPGSIWVQIIGPEKQVSYF